MATAPGDDEELTVLAREAEQALVLVRHTRTGETEWRFAAPPDPAPRAARRAKAGGGGAKRGGGAAAAEPARAAGAEAVAALELMRRMWHASGRPTTWWYWLADESQAAIGAQLAARDYAIVDDFVGGALCAQLRAELRGVRAAGLMRAGALAGGRAGSSKTYELAPVRGDEVGWFSGDEASLFDALPQYLKRVDTLVGELRDNALCADVAGVRARSRAMLTCYPGGGAHYVRHCDNACDSGAGERCNGRRLTAILYLNDGWTAADGGELRIYPRGDAHGEAPRAVVEPLADRLLLFFADHRCPHEVMPARAERYAITTWFFDGDEHARARAGGMAADEVSAEEARAIEREIARFEARYGAKAKIVAASAPGGGE